MAPAISTTIKMLTGQLRPKEGRATLLGLDVVREPNRVQAQIGVSFEATNRYEQMSAEANLKLFARLFRGSRFRTPAAPRTGRPQRPRQGARGRL